MTEFAYKKVQQLKASMDVVKKKVLVIYTGGTIGMERSERGTYVVTEKEPPVGLFDS